MGTGALGRIRNPPDSARPPWPRFGGAFLLRGDPSERVLSQIGFGHIWNCVFRRRNSLRVVVGRTFCIGVHRAGCAEGQPGYSGSRLKFLEMSRFEQRWTRASGTKTPTRAMRVTPRSEPAPSSPDRIVSLYYPVDVAAPGKLAGFFVRVDRLLMRKNIEEAKEPQAVLCVAGGANRAR
jgi:hypothetical protein